MNTLDYIANKYKVNIRQRRQPVEIPNTTRESLAQLFAELSFNYGAEIGVERGLYSKVLLEANPKLNLRCIDAWTAYDGYRDHLSQEKMDALYREAGENLEAYMPRAFIIKAFSTTIVHSIKNNSLDFVYLDANHEFQHVVNDISEWEKKVKVGGIVAGHDYIRRKNAQYLMQVPYAVDAYTQAYDIKPLFILGRKEAHGNTDPSKGELRDSTRSWFYVKQERKPMIPGNDPY